MSAPSASVENLAGNLGALSIHGGGDDEQRLKMVRRKKDFEFMELFKGRLVNIVQGLELHTNVFSPEEQKHIVDCVYEFQKLGRRGLLRGRTYLEPFKSMRGKGRVTIQFGCCYNYVMDKKGNPPGIILRPFCTVSFLSECKILFGTRITPLGPGDFVGPVAIPLPVGSVLVLNGNGADVAKHCVPAVPTKRISITFRKMDESKLPYNFKGDLEMQNLGKSPSQRVPIFGSPVQQQLHLARTSRVPLPSTSGSFQRTPEAADNKSVSPYKMGEQDFPSLVSRSSVLPKRLPSQLAPSAASPVQERGYNAWPVQVPVLSFLDVAAALPVQQQRDHYQAPRSRTNGSLQGQKGTPEVAQRESGRPFKVNEQDFPCLGSASSSSGRR